MSYFIIPILLIIIAILFYYQLRSTYLLRESYVDVDDLKEQNRKMKKTLDEVVDNYKRCIDIKEADENIFDLVRCINAPRKEVCKETGDGKVCRTRIIECNKFKNLVIQNPVAVDRMKMVQDVLANANK